MILNIATQISIVIAVLTGSGSISIDNDFVRISESQSEIAQEAAELAGSYSMEHEILIINTSAFPLRIDQIISTTETCEIKYFDKSEKKPGEKFRIRVMQKKIPVKPGSMNVSFLEIWFRSPVNDETHCKIEMRRKTFIKEDD